MHIVFLTNLFPSGRNVSGPARYVANIAEALVKSGHSVTVITESFDGKQSDLNKVQICKVKIVGMLGGSLIKNTPFGKAYNNLIRSICYYKQVRALAKRKHIDIVQSVSGYALALVRVRKIPYIVRVSEFPPLWRGANEENFDFEASLRPELDEKLSIMAVKRADAVIAPSKLLAGLLKERIGVEAEVVESPVMLDDTARTFSERQLMPGTYWLTFGKVIMRKEVHVIAAIVDRMLDEYPDMKWVMVGKDNGVIYRNKAMNASDLFRKLIKKHRDRFMYLGEITDKNRLFALIQNANACILPTRVDNLPNTVLEAMAFGKIVISTTGPHGTSVEQLISDGENGFLAKIDLAASLEEKIREVMRLDEAGRRSVERKAYDRVSGLSPEKVCDVMVKIYRRTIDEKRKSMWAELSAQYKDLTIVKKKRIEETYKTVMHKDIDWNHVRTFNEKMQWMKLYYRDYRVVLCADKLYVKKYLKRKGLGEHVPKTIAVYHSAEEIDYDRLPEKFVIKVTHGSGFVILCPNKAELNQKETNEKLNSWLNLRYGYVHNEWFYDVLKPRIFVEEFLKDEENSVPIDYKLFCFNGICKLIYTVKNRELKRKMYMDFYNREWQKQPFGRKYRTSKDGVKKPESLEQMIEMAEYLAKDFPFVRVDFYLCNNRLYIGELTFIPGNGLEAFKPSKYDRVYGAEFELPDKKEIKRKRAEYQHFRRFCKARNVLWN